MLESKDEGNEYLEQSDFLLQAYCAHAYERSLDVFMAICATKAWGRKRPPKKRYLTKNCEEAKGG